jgi:hypothetical protein
MQAERTKAIKMFVRIKRGYFMKIMRRRKKKKNTEGVCVSKML